MVKLFFLTALIFALIILSPMQLFAHADETISPSNLSLSDFAHWKPSQADITIIKLASQNSASVLRVRFNPANYPNVSFTPESAIDLSGKCLVVRVANPSDNPIQFYVRVDDDFSADGWNHSRTGEATIAGGQTADFELDVASPEANDISMRGYPPIFPGARTMRIYGTAINSSHIVRMQIFLSHPKSAATLDLEAITAMPLHSLVGIVDRYGQYTGCDWPGKVHNEADLASQRQEEATTLKPSAKIPGRDRFGGWLGGPTLASSRFFRTQMIDGKWWLVTPSGHLFFSAGINAMQPGAQTAISGGHAAMFTWLPDKTDPLAKQYVEMTGSVQGKTIKGAGFDFYAANLQRKYGDNYLDVWRDVSLKRLTAWGFNTVGNWSNALAPNSSVPYVITLGIWGSHARVPTPNDYWGAMHDPFDPVFVADLDRSINEHAAKVRDDPLCLGYFVDNELEWGSENFGVRNRLALAYGALALPASTSPAKRALIDDLRKTYPNVDDLDRAWGISLSNWADLNAPLNPQSDPNPAMEADLAAYVRHFADQYFSIVQAELHKVDPNHLYLGCRFSSYTDDVVKESAKYCDVLSFNIYKPAVDSKDWGFLNNLGKPCIVGEFHFGALDRGMFSPGLVQAADQKERGALFERYMESVLDMPAFVGAHWFEYVDEPLVGRFDGENYNIGFVSQADTVYPELVAASRRVLAGMYERRAGVGKLTTHQ